MENQELIPIIGTWLSDGMEYLLSVIVGISPMDVGGNIFTIQISVIMVACSSANTIIQSSTREKV